VQPNELAHQPPRERASSIKRGGLRR